MYEITESTFEEEVIQSNQPVLVDFFTTWCVPCKVLKSILEEIEDKFSNLKIVTVNIECSPHLAEKYMISAVPVILLFKGHNRRKIVGMRSNKDLIQIIESFLK